jgi:replicative DNA helicase
VVACYSHGQFPKEVFEAFNGLGQHGLEKRLAFFHRPGTTVDQVVSHAQRVADERGRAGSIFVDYLGLVRTATLRGDEFRVAEVMSKLRQLAQDLSAPLFVFSLMAPAAATETFIQAEDAEAVRRELIRRRPGLSDLAHPRRLQMEAASVLVLYNPEREMDAFLRREGRGPETAPLEAYVAADREGAVGSCRLMFDMKSGLIQEAEEGAPDGGDG